MECEVDTLASEQPNASTPDYNTFGFFVGPDPDDDACSDCSDCSCATADLHQLDLQPATIPTQEAKTELVVAPVTHCDDDACSTCSWATADDFDDRAWRVAGTGSVKLVEFTPITPYTPPVSITPYTPPVTINLFAEIEPAVPIVVAPATHRDDDACSTCSWATIDDFDDRAWRVAGPVNLVEFTPITPYTPPVPITLADPVPITLADPGVQRTARLPWGADSKFAKGHGSQSHVGEGATTIMLHNVPCRQSPDSRRHLFNKFAEFGFTNDCMDYVYIPMREKGPRREKGGRGGRHVGTGYMFVNLNTAELAADFCKVINDGNVRAISRTSKAVFCSLAVTQGLDACMEQFFLGSKGVGLCNAAWVRRGAEWTPVFRD